MKEDIVIVDNVISQENLEQMQDLFFSTNFPVFFEKTSCKCVGDQKDLFPNKTTSDAPQFAHLFVGEYKQNSQFVHIPIHVLNEFQQRVGLTTVNLERCRYNITLSRPDMDGLHLMPHVDSFVEGAYTAIFYINDSDGDTLFFSDGEIVHRVTPKANRVVCFPNHFVHCAELSKDTPYRAVLNYNFQLCNNEKIVKQEEKNGTQTTH